ncbi:Sec63 Brl domain-domain-containing protein [Catenaria anguillulae PL171]|uniref:Sec63 Brl domain-domain-containing protein n=1 Tax=Catenaria anguillulae PL171 TaxID=765915 RepID=A0A1Y2HQH3_9FUNG|nr:Sec63 Brl domain-domain-containing protein [Catenaria anguillulae PL171]
MTQYSYDDTGVYFAYFVVSVLTLILLPASYSWIAGRSQSFAKASSCQCSQCKAKFNANRKRDRQASWAWRFSKTVLILTGWSIVGYLGYVIYVTEIETPTQWDPWKVLGVAQSATKSEIRRAYRALSLTQHPDKVEDALKSKANEIFADISKAYKTLTNAEAFKKFEEWGDPDGKGSFSMGIALPTAIVAAHNSPWVLLAYGLVFGGLLPWRIGKWWYKTRKYTKDGVLSKSMGTLFKRTHEETGLKSMMVTLAQCAEFGDNDNVPFRGDADIKQCEALEPLIAAAFKAQGEEWDAARELKDVEGKPAARKALLHLLAHLSRPKGYVPSADAQRTITKMAHLVQRGLLQITLARGWLIPSLYSMDLTQLMSQGTWHTRSALLQVPHVTVDHVKSMMARDPPVRSLQDFAEIGEKDRRGLFKGLKEDQFKDMVAFLAAYPRIVLEKLDFKVIGEPNITPGSLVTCILKVRLAPISISMDELKKEYDAKKAAKADGANNKGTDQDVDEDEEDVDALGLDGEGDGGRGTAATAKLAPQVKFSHSPRFPADKRPGWWVFIGNLGANRVINATRVGDLQDRKTIKVQFQAPGQPGVYPFSVFIKSDHWVGADMRLDVQMKVDPMDQERMAALARAEQEDEISDPEEDTLAGQMAVLRGQKTKQMGEEGQDGEWEDEESSSDED